LRYLSERFSLIHGVCSNGNSNSCVCMMLRPCMHLVTRPFFRQPMVSELDRCAYTKLLPTRLGPLILRSEYSISILGETVLTFLLLFSCLIAFRTGACVWRLHRGHLPEPCRDPVFLLLLARRGPTSVLISVSACVASLARAMRLHFWFLLALSVDSRLA
jgi:hypothetical protein